MLGAGNNSDEQGKMTGEDLADNLQGNDPRISPDLNAVISAAISSTNDDMSEKLKQLANRLSRTPRIHTLENLEVAYAESVDRIIANRLKDTAEGEQESVLREGLTIHGHALRALEIRAACRGVSVEFIAMELLQENEQRCCQRPDP